VAVDSSVGFDDKAQHVGGDTATVADDVMFGDSAAYTDLSGLIPRVDGTWVVSRTEFCTFMASARNACPS
jgi:iron complex transport system substrate-binding protein